MKTRQDRNGRPLDAAGLERLALFYVGRYATTRAKLRSYLLRKLSERGWEGEKPAVQRLVERLAALGYVDDAAFAEARTAVLQRRGLGERRIVQALAAAGIEAGDVETATVRARDGTLEAAVRFARRRRIGPFAEGRPDRAGREKAFAAMLRAGHPLDLVRRILDCGPEEAEELLGGKATGW